MSADGHLSVWQDVGEEVRLEEEKERLRKAALQQSLDNFKAQHNWVEALRLALDLDRPYE